MKLHKKLLLVIIVLIGVSTLLIWAFLGGRKELAMEQEREQPVKAPSRVSILDGESVVTLSRAEEIKNGIVVAPLQPVSHQEKLKAYGTVMELRDLFDLYNSYVAAKAQVEKATASLDASQREYERLKPLHENNRNISDKTFQAAEAAWRSNEADAHAAQAAVHAIEATVRQRWGAVIARWLVEKSPVFNRLKQQQDVLIQTTLPPDTHLASAPQTALGLLPLAIGSGTPGREIEGPMAIVILGGLVTSTALNLLVLPTLALRYGRFEREGEKPIGGLDVMQA